MEQREERREECSNGGRYLGCGRDSGEIWEFTWCCCGVNPLLGVLDFGGVGLAPF